jgi:hypothetical protein
MRWFIFGCFLLAWALSGQAARAGTVLITAEEAKLPPPAKTKNIAFVTRGITRKPSIVLVSPEASVTSPFTLQLKFEAHGGSTITPNSFHLIYLRSPNIDLTGRVKPFETTDGLTMVDAEAPPGQYLLRVEVSDSANREASTVFTLNVRK